MCSVSDFIYILWIDVLLSLMNLSQQANNLSSVNISCIDCVYSLSCMDFVSCLLCIQFELYMSCMHFVSLFHA